MLPLRLLSRLLPAIGLLVLAACGQLPLPGAERTNPDEGEPTGSLRDEFVPGRTGNWLLEQDEVGSSTLVNDQLLITVAAPNTLQYAALDDRLFSDFVLEVDAWQRAGPPESSYGVLFRLQDDGRFYRFDITSNGLFMIERRNADGTWARLIPEWTATAAINQGLNVANRLKVIAAGSEMAFYVNDILLIQLSDPTLTEGRIALDAGSFAGNTLQVAFDNLSVTAE